MAERDTPYVPMMCVTNCGFFGNPSNGGMCSKCFLDSDQKNDESVVQQSLMNTESSVLIEAPADLSKDVIERPVQRKKNRCWECKTKLRLAQQFNCKCGYIFCKEHRYADRHLCDFDYKGAQQNALKESNPVVAADKITRI